LNQSRASTGIPPDSLSSKTALAQEPALRDLLVERYVQTREEAIRTAYKYRAGLNHEEVDALLRAHGLDMGMIMGAAFERKTRDIEKVDRMLIAASARRDAALREIERRRDSLAARVKRAIDIAAQPEDVADVVDVPIS
jgi:hypothetical protein